MSVRPNTPDKDPLETQEWLYSAAYREHASGKSANRPRNHTMFPVEDRRHPGFHYRFKSQEGGNLSSGVWALRVTSDMAGGGTPAAGTKRRRVVPAGRG